MDIAVIVNKQARNAKTIDTYLETFTSRAIKYRLYEVSAEELEETLQHCIERYSMILIGGGDGTVRTAAEKCANTSIILGVLPLGTMNHFAKELGLPSNPEDFVQAVISQPIISVDLAQVNGSIFINNSSIGFYPRLAQKRDYYTRFYNKWLSYIPSFIETLRNHESFTLTIEDKNLKFSIRTSFFMVSNNLYSYEFPINICRKQLNESILGLYFFKHGRMRLSKILRAWIMRKKSFEIKKTSLALKVEILSKKTVLISLDGDTVTKTLPLIYNILPQALKLLGPARP